MEIADTRWDRFEGHNPPMPPHNVRKPDRFGSNIGPDLDDGVVRRAERYRRNPESPVVIAEEAEPEGEL